MTFVKQPQHASAFYFVRSYTFHVFQVALVSVLLSLVYVVKGTAVRF